MTAQMKEIIGGTKTSDQIIYTLEKVCAYFQDNGRTILILHKCHADREITDVLYELNQNFQMYNLSERYVNTLGKESLHLVSVFFYTGCYNILLDWVRNNIPLTPREMAELMVRLARENFLG